MFEALDSNFLFVYSYKDDIKTTVYYYDDKEDISHLFNMVNDLIVRNIPFVEKVVKGLIVRLSSATTPELGLNPQKISEHLKICCDENKIFIDENKKNIRVSFRDITITYKLDGYHKDE